MKSRLKSEMGVASRALCNLHRAEITWFFRAEVLFFIATLATQKIAGRHWFPELRSLERVWFYVIPACLFQLALALRLGLATNRRNPTLPVARLALDPAAIAGVAYALLGLNAVVLTAILYPTWSFFYEWTGFYVPVLLLLGPAIAFGVSGSFRDSLRGLSAGILAIIAIWGPLAIIEWRRDGVEGYGPILFDEYLRHVLLLLACTVGPMIFSKYRRAFFPSILTCGSLFAVLLLHGGWRIERAIRSDEYARVTALADRTTLAAPACKRFRDQVDRLNIALGSGSSDVALPDRERVIEATRIVSEFPDAPYSREDYLERRRALPNQVPIGIFVEKLQSARPCGPVDFFTVAKRIMYSVDGTRKIGFADRQEMRRVLRNKIPAFVASAVYITQALVSIALIERAVDLGLVTHIDLIEVRRISESLREIKSKAHGWSDPYVRMRGMSGSRWREFELGHNERDYFAVKPLVDRMVKILAEAKWQQ